MWKKVLLFFVVCLFVCFLKDNKVVHRQFGEFDCPCGRSWKSASSWKNVWQECKVCGSKVTPENLRPLLYTGVSGHKPHETERCGMCKKLGYNCKNALAGGDGGDDDDDLSVYSEASTNSSSSVDDRDLNDFTPVASEDEDDLGKRLDTVLKF